MIEHTIVARCDHPGCTTVQDLRPDTTQPFRDLTEIGWMNEVVDGEAKTYCPDHTPS